MNSIFTIGHSAHTIEHFLQLLARHSIEVVVDVRSAPTSMRHPHFDLESLYASLQAIELKYLYLGNALGGRGNSPTDFVDGKVSYSRLAKRLEFAEALDRVRRGIGKFRVALMCAERDPANCHRAVLICRHLRSTGLDIKHILADGSVESHREFELRLLKLNGLPDRDLFQSTEDLIERAYDIQGAKIAFTSSGPSREVHELA